MNHRSLKRAENCRLFGRTSVSFHARFAELHPVQYEGASTTGDTGVASTWSPTGIAFTAKTEAPKTQIFRPICQESDAEHVDVIFTHFRGVFPCLEQVSLMKRRAAGPTRGQPSLSGATGSPTRPKGGSFRTKTPPTCRAEQELQDDHLFISVAVLCAENEVDQTRSLGRTDDGRSSGAEQHTSSKLAQIGAKSPQESHQRVEEVKTNNLAAFSSS